MKKKMDLNLCVGSACWALVFNVPQSLRSSSVSFLCFYELRPSMISKSYFVFFYFIIIDFYNYYFFAFFSNG